MYSVVLMAALSGGTANPAWCHRWACHGCYGCQGCHCGGWCGHGCAGAWGGHCAHFAAYPPVGLGYSFCDFCGCYACYGNGWGRGLGLYANGFYGNGYGGWGSGCYCGCFNAIGCYCGYSCWGVPPGAVGPVAPPPPPRGKDVENKGKEETTARLIVNVPAEAKVYVDGRLMKAGEGRRVFSTPTLQRGQTYFYDVKAEVVRDGQTVSRTQRIFLRGGDVATASFEELSRPAVTVRTDD